MPPVPAYYVPVPRTWTANEIIKAPALRADVTGAIQLLSTPPMFQAGQTTANQNLAAVNTGYNVTLDTETYDNFGGHLTTTASAQYFGMFPGWYLVEVEGTLVTTSVTGQFFAGISAVQNGSAFGTFYGSRMLVTATSAAYPAATASKLVLMQRTGVFNGAGNDYITFTVAQNVGVNIHLANATTGFVNNMSVRWVSAISGTAGLSPPVNNAWPVPPSIVTSSFMNTNVRDALRFLLYRPIMEAFNNAAAQTLFSQTTLPSVGSTATLDSTAVDNYSAYNTSTHVWTAPCGGLFYVYGAVCITANGTTRSLAAGLTVTSGNYNSGSTVTLWGGAGQVSTGTAINTTNVRRRLRLNATDTIALAVYQHDTASASVTMGTGATNTSRLIIVWEAA